MPGMKTLKWEVLFVLILASTMQLACKCCGSSEKLESIAPAIPGVTSSGGASSIEELGEKLFEAGSDGDLEAVMDLFPSAELAEEEPLPQGCAF